MRLVGFLSLYPNANGRLTFVGERGKRKVAKVRINLRHFYYLWFYFTTNFLFRVIYTPGFRPSSDSPSERTFLPVRS